MLERKRILTASLFSRMQVDTLTFEFLTSLVTLILSLPMSLHGLPETLIKSLLHGHGVLLIIEMNYTFSWMVLRCRTLLDMGHQFNRIYKKLFEPLTQKKLLD